jgi:hypothetical protein
MQPLVSPEILKLCLPLGLPTLGLGLLIGALLWLMGGWGHRFCIVLVTTLIAGVVGLQCGPIWGMQPLVAGLLLAVAAGALALSLVRVVVFFLVGFGAFYLGRIVMPNWEPVACFVAGGVLGVVFFRIWIMAAASLAGTLLMAYSILSILGQLAKVDVEAWADKNGPLMNWGCLSVAVLGILVQLLVQRRGSKPKSKSKPKSSPKPAPAPQAAPPPPPPPAPPPPPPRPFLLRWLPSGDRKVG